MREMFYSYENVYVTIRAKFDTETQICKLKESCVKRMAESVPISNKFFLLVIRDFFCIY